MNVNDFIKVREKDWKRLETLIDKRRARATLSADEVRELGVLYRAVTSDLALARRDYPSQRVTAFLNQLLTRTHSYIYQEDVSDARPVGRYFTQILPRTFRQTWVFTLVAFLLFLIPAIVAFRLTYTNPDNAIPLGLQGMREYLQDKETWTNIPVNERPYASSFIMTNNIRVSILAFGGGITFGLFSAWLLATNGIMLGGVLGLAWHYDMSETLVKFVIGHGVIELSVIFISAGAGLQLGWALLNPGPYSRRDALGIAARKAMILAMAAVPLLIIAGTIEGFFSPRTETPFSLHIAVGLISGAIMYAYLLLVGRRLNSTGEISSRSRSSAKPV
jgi:uncharacterized membrane protein SpoIIM required for sporulation